MSTTLRLVARAGIEPGLLINKTGPQTESLCVCEICRNPTPVPYRGVQWPRVSSSHHKEYIQIDRDGLKSKRGLLEEKAAFWKDLPLVTSPTTSRKDEL
jgi:hypothetical protein